MKQVLCARNLGFLYSNKKGIRDISFSSNRGDMLCFFGKNGSGKSTLLSLVSTLVSPQAGSLSIFGLDACAHRDLVRKYIFSVFDENAHFDFATGWENLLFFLFAYGRVRSVDIETLRQQLDLDLSMKVGEYSYGMRRKLYVMEAFLSQRQILLFDEPTLGLDSSSRQRFFQRCKEEMNLGKTIIISTNRLEDAKSAGHVLFLENGHGRFLDSVSDVAPQLTKVTIRTSHDELTEYISNLDELPALIHGYLQVDAINRIDIENTSDSLVWTKEALEKIERAPQFLRKMIYRLVEEYARKENVYRITPAVVDASRGRFERR